jgi:acyl-CoA synthetase (AMP-forming)/AMP-acid ligase II
VVRRAGASAEETTIRAQLAEPLARFKIPKYVRFVDELPRTATGKIQRARLRSEFGADQERRLPDR